LLRESFSSQSDSDCNPTAARENPFNVNKTSPVKKTFSMNDPIKPGPLQPVLGSTYIKEYSI
jgi:hypothetical protein